jgi:hypothetical protein
MQRVATLSLALLAPSVAGAQRTTDVSFFAGVTSGAFSQSSPSSGTVGGHTAGFTWTVPVLAIGSLEVGASFVQKGGFVNGTDIQLTYIETPVSLRISDESEDTGVHAFVRVGAALALKKGCKGNSDIVEPTLADVIFAPGFGGRGTVCSNLRAPAQDFGPLAGIGFIWRDESLRFTFEARRTEGRRLNPAGGGSLTPSTTSFIVGLGFPR